MNKNKPVPRPEYPRPQAERNDWINLNGKWEFELDCGLSGEERGFNAGASFSMEITIPFCPESKLSGIQIKDFMPCVWYRRKFRVPDGWVNKTIFLHFGAVDYEATVWVNGKLAGTHRGGYSPFSFQITSFIEKGENTVVVRAADDTRGPLQPSGKQSLKYNSYGCYYTRTTGIWQTVWLEAVGHTYLDSFKFYPDIDNGSVAIHAFINGVTKGFILNAKVFAKGKEVGSINIHLSNFMVFEIKLSEINLWQPGNPFLYDIEFSIIKDGRQIDRLKSYFGMRRISIEGKNVFINNKIVFQRLVLDQGYYPDGIYTAPSDEDLRKDIEISTAVGFNGARLHQKVFEPRFLYWADRIGYLLWGEYPSWGLDHGHPLALERVLPEWLEVLKRDFNHPSIIGWCPFNETKISQNPELLRNIYKATKSIDSTRPVIDASGYVHVQTDIYDCHNYKQDISEFASCFECFKNTEKIWQNFSDNEAPYGGQPYFVSEYGGIWWNPGQPGKEGWGYGARPATQEEFLSRYRALTETLLFHPRMFGFCYTQLYDIEQEVNGLYTYDRKSKFDPEVIKEINTQQAVIEKYGLK